MIERVHVGDAAVGENENDAFGLGGKMAGPGRERVGGRFFREEIGDDAGEKNRAADETLQDGAATHWAIEEAHRLINIDEFVETEKGAREGAPGFEFGVFGFFGFELFANGFDEAGAFFDFVGSGRTREGHFVGAVDALVVAGDLEEALRETAGLFVNEFVVEEIKGLQRSGAGGAESGAGGGISAVEDGEVWIALDALGH